MGVHQHGRDLDMIGWSVSLTGRWVGLAKKNHLKALCGFSTIGASSQFKVPEVERAAAWASRYGQVFPG